MSVKLPLRGPFAAPSCHCEGVTGNTGDEQVLCYGYLFSQFLSYPQDLYIWLIYLGRVQRRHGALLWNPAWAEYSSCVNSPVHYWLVILVGHIHPELFLIQNVQDESMNNEDK